MNTRPKENKWTDLLHDGVYYRLCECRNTRQDLKPLVKAMWNWRKEKEPQLEKEDVVIQILEWVGDWNGQYNVTDVTEDEYNELLKA